MPLVVALRYARIGQLKMAISLGSAIRATLIGFTGWRLLIGVRRTVRNEQSPWRLGVPLLVLCAAIAVGNHLIPRVAAIAVLSVADVSVFVVAVSLALAARATSRDVPLERRLETALARFFPAPAGKLIATEML
nr:hypothetical protein [Candidatus Eremiobacteraeota bacterium]